MKEKILTTSDIASLLGVHQITISRWINSGKLKALQTLGGQKRVKKRDLIEFFNENSMPIPEELCKPSEKARILIVDDDEAVLSIIEESLKAADEDFIVKTATDGFEAGQILEKFKPDIIILDIFLPTIDGYKVCRSVKENYKNIKIIAITGYGSEEVKKKIMEAGADIYLEKSFEIDDLLSEIESVLNKRLLKQSSE